MTRAVTRRRIVVLLILACLGGVLLLILRPVDTSYLDLLRLGDAHAAKAERTAAVAAYRQAARLRPHDPQPYLRLARVYLAWGQRDEALLALDEAERLGADEIDVARLRVEVHVARADWIAVVEHARGLLDLVPDDRDAGHALAYARVQLRQWEAARAGYEALLRINPVDSLAHERLGALLLGEENSSALQHLFAADTGLANRLLSVLQEQSVTDEPAYVSALLGRELAEAEEWALAARQFERAVAASPGYADAHAYLGYALDQMGLTRIAYRHLTRAVSLAPESAPAHIFLGLHYDRSNDIAAARAEYEQAYDLDSSNPAVCVEIGQTWASERRYVAAEIWLREAVSLRPEDPALWRILVRFYLDHNITAEGRATEAAVQLLERSPDDARAHDLRGWAALQVEDYDTAEEHLRRALDLDPSLASIHYHLGLLQVALGEPRKARESFVRALDLDTTGELAPLIQRAVEELPQFPQELSGSSHSRP